MWQRSALRQLNSLLVLASLLAPPLALGQVPRTFTATVVKVVDGDTIHVRLGNRIEKVRYIGVNAPELHHPTKGEHLGGREAAEANRNLVKGQAVRLELDVQERDEYGRLLAYVYVGDIMVNAELVAQGYAQVMSIPPNVRYQDLFLKLQREARLLQVGLWKDTSVPAASGSSAASPRATDQPPSNPAPPGLQAQGRPGVPPQAAWTCPAGHPIKGNFTTSSGERCIYHPPGGAFYGKTRPERCYATGEEAVRDGCRASKQ